VTYSHTMFSAPKIVTRTSPTRRPRGQRGFARLVVVFASAAFLLTTTFSPCCEALVTCFGDQTGANAAADAHPAHDSNEAHFGHPDHSPYPPCGQTVSASLENISQADILAAEHPEFASITLHPTISLLPSAVSAFSPTAYLTHPPEVPLYLRDLRIRV
jgi:hypothetical protein